MTMATTSKNGRGVGARRPYHYPEQGRRTNHTARLIDVRWWMWMLRSESDKALMEKLRERKAAKAARLSTRRQHAAERRLFRRVPKVSVS